MSGSLFCEANAKHAYRMLQQELTMAIEASTDERDTKAQRKARPQACRAQERGFGSISLRSRTRVALVIPRRCRQRQRLTLEARGASSASGSITPHDCWFREAGPTAWTPRKAPRKLRFLIYDCNPRLHCFPFFYFQALDLPHAFGSFRPARRYLLPLFWPLRRSA